MGSYGGTVRHGSTRARSRPRLAPLLALGCVLVLAAFASTACEGMPTARTATPTPMPTTTPTPTHPGITLLSVAVGQTALPSPDGTMLATADSHPVTVTIYTLQGKVLAQATAPANSVFSYHWLPDSSGLLIWPEDPSGPPGPLSVLSPQGSMQSTGLPSVDATPSPDEMWIAAATGYGVSSSPSAVEVAPRHGGAVRTLASGVGVRLLGWQGSSVVYAANGNIYAMSPTGGSARLLVSEGGVAWGPPDGIPPFMSPDGQVLIFFGRQHGFARLVGTQVLPIPPAAADAPADTQLVLWTGPHEALGLVGVTTADVEVEVVTVDMVSGELVQDTGAKAPPIVEALSGEWVAAWAQAALGQPETLHFTNLVTTREVDLGPAPTPGEVYSLGHGQFLLNGRGQSYLLDPTAAGLA